MSEMRNKEKDSMRKLLASYPRKHPVLPESYQKIYEQHYKENRDGSTKASAYARKFEGCLHKKIAKSARGGVQKTLEIGAGNLNQLNYERSGAYDIVEPFQMLFKNSPNLKYVRNIYSDISEVKHEKYDRITSIACFEHVEDLPKMVRLTARLLNQNGKLYIVIPNEGRLLWKIAYMATTGREFEKRYGLGYETMIRHEHINTADEIEKILKYYYKNVKIRFLGIGRVFSIFRYYECSVPVKRKKTG